jgi:ribosomal protein S18 acetylase RimI-like enzyme
MATIRAALRTDFPALAALWQEKLVLQADPRLTPSPERWTAGASAWLDDPRCALFVAEDDGRAIGYIAGWIQPFAGVTGDALGVITEIAIDTHGYHAGTGRALLDALRAWFHMRGVDAIVVLTSRRLAMEQAFWRSVGATDWMDMWWIKS